MAANCAQCHTSIRDEYLYNLASGSHCKNNGNNNMPWEIMQREIQSLVDISLKFDTDQIKRKLQQMIPDYAPQDFYALGKDLNLDVTSIKGEA